MNKLTREAGGMDLKQFSIKSGGENLPGKLNSTLHRPHKDLGTFCNTKHNVHRFTLNLHRLKIMIVESLINVP